MSQAGIATPIEMKAEALSRMASLKLFPKAINEFKEDGIINKSEAMGFLYWLSDEENGMIHELEEKYGFLAYHAVKSKMEDMWMTAYLIVSKYKEDWRVDAADLKEGMVLAYVVNETYPDCSEMGTIGVRPANGGIVRTF